MSNMKSLKRTHLNAAELECVAIISEECGETVQAAQKLVRFGVNPFYDNWANFEKEAGEILAALSFAIRSGRMSGTKVFESCQRKLNDYETMLINQE